MRIEPYLERLGYAGPLEPDSETLRLLHRAHMLAVPFENLDIPLRRPIVLSLPAFYDKIVRRRRGGFCYELNGLFAWLLERLGFSVTLFSARVFSSGQPGPEFDHLVLLVQLDEAWIADVGFGDSFLEPIQLEDAGEVAQHGSSYRLRRTGEGRVLERRQPETEWEPQYVFSPVPRRLDEFGPMCQYQQTSPASIFTQKVVCSRATPDGRITFANGRWIETRGGERAERPVVDDTEFLELLRTRFGIAFEPGTRIENLLPPKPSGRG